MEQKIKYIGKAEGTDLHPDYEGAELYKYEFEGEPITIIVRNSEVISICHSAKRGCKSFKFEASKEYEEVIKYLEQQKLT